MGLLFGKNKNVIGFNFSGDMVRIACARILSGKAEITDLKTCNIEGLTDEAAAKVIKDVVKEFKIKKPVFVSSIDSQSIITKNIEIPSLKESEIREIIDLQAGRYTPYGRGEIIVDHINIGTYYNSYTKVLVVIVVQEIIKKQFSILDKAGFNISKVQFSSESIGCVCSKILSLSLKATSSIIVNIEDKNTDFIILFKGKTIFVRSIPIGYDNFKLDKDATAVKFVEEIKKSLDAYRSEDIEASPDELIFIGALDIADTVKPGISQALGMPIRNILFHGGSISLSKDILSTNRHLSFISAISAMLSMEDTSIDLRPSDLKMKVEFQERSKEIIKSGALLMFILIAICGIMFVKIYYRGVYLSKLEEQLNTIEPQVSELEKTSNKVVIVKRLLESKTRSLDLMSQLHDLVSDNIYLKSVTIDEKGGINIKGTATAMSEVFNFVTLLENSQYFQNASAANTSSRKEGNKDVSDFEITCVLKKKIKTGI
jgi:Tfp pilus assembly protein PilN